MTPIEELGERLLKYKLYPVEFVQDVFDVELDPWQKDALRKIATNQKLAIAGCTGVGKDFLAACVIWWFLCTNHYPKVICTAVKQDTLKDNLWAELSRLMRRSPLIQTLFNYGVEKISAKGAEEEWFAVARTASKRYSSGGGNAQAEGLAGKYSDDTLAILDEASGIDDSVFNALSGSASTPRRKMMAIGNPLRNSGWFAQLFLDRAFNQDWQTMNVSYLDSIRTSGTPEVRSIREKWIEMYGMNSAYVQARVFGQFPTDSSDDTVLFRNEILKAFNRRLKDDESLQLVIGVDCARFGCVDDKTEVLTKDGWKFFEQVSNGDDVLVLDGEISRWGKCHEVVKVRYQGKMNLYDGEKVNFCLTPEHGIIARGPRQKQFRTDRLENLPKEFMIPRMNTWYAESPREISFNFERIMPYGGVHRRTWTFDFLDWAEFVGWFVSEGNVYLDKRGRYRIMIAQYPGWKKEKLRSLLKSMKVYFAEKNTNQFEIPNREIGKHLLKVCGHGASNKMLPDYILNGSTEVMERFLLGYGLGDGTRKSNGTINYFTTSTILANQVHEILVKLGVAGKIAVRELAGSVGVINGRQITRQYDIHTITQRATRRDSTIEKSKIKQIDYNGFVYCLRTETGNMMVRRNGCCMWTGNSDESVYVVRRGMKMLDMVCESMTSAVDVVNRCKQLAQYWSPEEVDVRKNTEFRVDEAGFGGGIVDFLRDDKWVAVGINNGCKSTMPDYYYNLGSELWIEDMKEAIQTCQLVGVGGTFEVDDELLRQLEQRQYTFTLKGTQRRIITKDELRKRGIKSPDRADAVVLAFAKSEKLDVGLAVMSSIMFL